MLNEKKVEERYQENYQLAIELDGHTENAQEIAWAWTETELLHRLKSRHEDAHTEAVNKAFYG